MGNALRQRNSVRPIGRPFTRADAVFSHHRLVTSAALRNLRRVTSAQVFAVRRRIRRETQPNSKILPTRRRPLAGRHRSVSTATSLGDPLQAWMPLYALPTRVLGESQLSSQLCGAICRTFSMSLINL